MEQAEGGVADFIELIYACSGSLLKLIVPWLPLRLYERGHVSYYKN